VTVDGQPVQPPYRLAAIGDAQVLEAALLRPGGLVSLLQSAGARISIVVAPSEKLTLPVCEQPVDFVYARAVK
jgi:uncharacterized protein YlxW (UPF0749 family)